MDDTRIKKLQKLLKEKKINALLVDDPVDLFYLTGLHLSVGRLVLFRDQASLFVDGRYLEAAKRKAPCQVQPKEELSHFLETLESLSFDSSFMTVDGQRSLEKMIPGKKWVGISKPLKSMRWIKEKKEIDILRKAAGLNWEGFQHLKKNLKSGVTEEELAVEFECFCRKKGASALSFPSIIAFGENSAYPHYRSGKIPLRDNQWILFDLGVVVDGYAADMTRGLFFGHPEPQIKKDYELVQKATLQAIEMIRPGLRFGELDRVVREMLKKEGVESLFIHNLSHGVGLDVHEFPILRTEEGDQDVLLEPGMVFTVEPGLYRPGLGGVRFEDTVVVTEEGVENFYSKC